MDIKGLKRVVFSEDQLNQRIEELAGQINTDYADKNPVIICILKGPMYFVADLTRKLDIPVTIDFMSIGVYQGASIKTGVVRINKDLDLDISGKHVLIIEDIINTGLTMGYLVQNMESKKPADIKICTLLNNPRKRLVNIPLAYVGFEVPDIFLVGYGLDFEQNYRHLPYIAEFSSARL